MATYKNHVILSSVEDNGDVNEFYPITDASDVSFNRNDNIPSNIDNIQQLLDNMTGNAFGLVDDAVIIGNEKSINNPVSTEIDDSKTSVTTLWSSNKIKDYVKNNTINIHKSHINNDLYNVINTTTPYPTTYCINTIGFKDKDIILPKIFDSNKNKDVYVRGRYIVEYFPQITDSSNHQHYDGFQRWTYVDDPDNIYVFTRTCINGIWNNFVPMTYNKK